MPQKFSHSWTLSDCGSVDGAMDHNGGLAGAGDLKGVFQKHGIGFIETDVITTTS